MNKTHRTGMNVRVAFAGEARLASVAKYSGADSSRIASGEPRGLLERLVRRALRPVKRIATRVGRGFARPLATQARAFMTSDLLEQSKLVQREMLNIHAALLQSQTDAKRAQVELLAQIAQVTNQSKNLESLLADQRSLRTVVERFEHQAALATRQLLVDQEIRDILVGSSVGYLVCPASDRDVYSTAVAKEEARPGIRLLLETLLAPGDVFVDLGADRGLHSLAAARAMQGKGKIFALAQSLPVARLLERTFWINGLSSLAVTGVDCTARGQQPTAQSQSHSFEFDNAANANNASSVSLVLPIAELLDAEERVDVIKLSLSATSQGMHEGLAAVINRHPDVLLVVNTDSDHRFESALSPQACTEYFVNQGFSVSTVDPISGKLNQRRDVQLGDADSSGLLFARPDASIWHRLGAAR